MDSRPIALRNPSVVPPEYTEGLFHHAIELISSFVVRISLVDVTRLALEWGSL